MPDLTICSGILSVFLQPLASRVEGHSCRKNGCHNSRYAWSWETTCQHFFGLGNSLEALLTNGLRCLLVELTEHTHSASVALPRALVFTVEL